MDVEEHSWTCLWNSISQVSCNYSFSLLEVNVKNKTQPVSTSILFSTWILFTSLFAMFYSSQLVTNITTYRPRPPFTDLKTLLEQPEYTIIAPGNTSLFGKFQVRMGTKQKWDPHTKCGSPQSSVLQLPSTLQQLPYSRCRFVPSTLVNAWNLPFCKKSENTQPYQHLTAKKSFPKIANNKSWLTCTQQDKALRATCNCSELLLLSVDFCSGFALKVAKLTNEMNILYATDFISPRVEETDK